MAQNRMSWVPTLTTADTAVKRNQCFFQLRASGHTSLPAGGGKAVFHGRFAAKRFESGSCPALSVFTHSVRFSLNTDQTDAPRFRHTSNVGGVSVTLQTALAVNSGAPGWTVRGDDIDRRAHAGHRIAKSLLIDNVHSLLLTTARRLLQRTDVAGAQKFAGIAIADINQQIALQRAARKKASSTY